MSRYCLEQGPYGLLQSILNAMGGVRMNYRGPKGEPDARKGHLCGSSSLAHGSIAHAELFC